MQWGNLFATEDYQLQKPRKRVIPKMRDLQNFLNKDPGLTKLANFGMEMMKWLPKFEQMYLAGEEFADQEDKDAGNVVYLDHGNGLEGKTKQTSEVTKDWWNEFNRYQVEDGEMDSVFGGFASAYLNDSHDAEFRPRTNGESVTRWEQLRAEEGGGADGFSDWRDATWISGQRHRSSGFGPGDEGDDTVWAGKDIGLSYKNLDFYTAAKEWNHIKVPKKEEFDAAAGAAVADHYFITDEEMTMLGTTWDGIQTTLAKFGDKSFYDIVMSKTWKVGNYGSYSIDAQDQRNLILAMKESSRRIANMEATVFGPLGSTRSDAAMMQYAENFVRSHVPYNNFHEIALFQNFFQLQHGVTNFMSAFWGCSPGTGYCYGLLDKVRFWDFSIAMGARDFNDYLQDNADYDVNNDYVADQDGSNPGLLYVWRNSYMKQSEYDALSASEKESKEKAVKFKKANNFIKSWFGSFYPEYSKANGLGATNDLADFVVNGDSNKVEFAGGDGWAPTSTDYGGQWVAVSVGGSTKYVFKINDDLASYGYDRKFNEHALWVSNSSNGSGAYEVSAGDDTNTWKEIVNKVYGAYINQAVTYNFTHSNYSAGQFYGLNSSWIVSGKEYNNNWVVHLVGELWKNGLGMAQTRLVQRRMQQQKDERDFKADTQQMYEKADEIALNKKLEAQQMAKNEANRNADKKMAAKRRSDQNKVNQAEQKKSNEARSERQRQDNERVMQRSEQKKQPAAKPKKA
jgi:hypothetical protein